MKNKNKILIIAIVLVLVYAALIYVNSSREEREKETVSGKIIVDFEVTENVDNCWYVFKGIKIDFPCRVGKRIVLIEVG